MKRLTQTQINHFTTRIDEEVKKLENSFRQQLGPRPMVRVPSNQEMVKAIRNGTATIDPNAEIYHYTSAFNIFIYPDDAKRAVERKAQEEYDKKVDTYVKELAQYKQSVIDNAVLGDAAEAMNLMQYFGKRAHDAAYARVALETGTAPLKLSTRRRSTKKKA